MILSEEGANIAVTSVIYAWMCEHGTDIKIPDFTRTFGGLSDEDKLALGLCFEVARNQALGIQYLYPEVDGEP